MSLFPCDLREFEGHPQPNGVCVCVYTFPPKVLQLQWLHSRSRHLLSVEWAEIGNGSLCVMREREREREREWRYIAREWE